MSKSRSANYSAAEDQHLCGIFLDVSQDPIVGINQSRDQFWKRIATKFHSDKPNPPIKIKDHTQRSLQCRMGTILKDTRKFNGCLSQIEYMNPSGANDQDLFTQANDLLMQQKDYDNGFKFEHVWPMLKDFVQAETTGGFSSLPEENIPESPNPSLSSFPLNLDSDDGFASGGSSSQRPDGVKKAKLKRKQKEDTSTAASVFENENEKLRQTILASSQMKAETKMLLREDNILMIDLDTIRDPARREYFRQEQQKVLQKRGITQHGDDSSYFPNLFPDIAGSGGGLSDY